MGPSKLPTGQLLLLDRHVMPRRTSRTTPAPQRPGRRAGPRWRRLPEERPRQILDAALEVFGERGLAGARLDDIARRAGVSKGTIYLYFANKEELFREMIRGTLVETLVDGERLPDEGPAETQLRAFMR